MKLDLEILAGKLIELRETKDHAPIIKFPRPNDTINNMIINFFEDINKLPILNLLIHSLIRSLVIQIYKNFIVVLIKIFGIMILLWEFLIVPICFD